MNNRCYVILHFRTDIALCSNNTAHKRVKSCVAVCFSTNYADNDRK